LAFAAISAQPYRGYEYDRPILLGDRYQYYSDATYESDYGYGYDRPLPYASNLLVPRLLEVSDDYYQRYGGPVSVGDDYGYSPEVSNYGYGYSAPRPLVVHPNGAIVPIEEPANVAARIEHHKAKQEAVARNLGY
jgi:hypothetical protein